MFLPIADQQLCVQQAETIEAVATGNAHILFVDDESSLAELGKIMLEHLGYTVSTRTSSIEALEAFRSSPENLTS